LAPFRSLVCGSFLLPFFSSPGSTRFGNERRRATFLGTESSKSPFV
jgi:hypothetical protein